MAVVAEAVVTTEYGTLKAEEEVKDLALETHTTHTETLITQVI